MTNLKHPGRPRKDGRVKAGFMLSGENKARIETIAKEAGKSASDALNDWLDATAAAYAETLLERKKEALKAQFGEREAD